MSPLSQFNDKFQELVQDLRSIVEQRDPDFQKLEAYLDILHVNARVIINCFKKYVITDESRYFIFTENHDFFLDNTYSTYTETSQYYFNLMVKIKKYWHVLTPVEKNSMFNYFKILTYYADLDEDRNTQKEFTRVARIYSPDGEASSGTQGDGTAPSTSGT